MQDLDDEETVAVGELVDGLPEYSKDEIAKHKNVNARIWVSVSLGYLHH